MDYKIRENWTWRYTKNTEISLYFFSFAENLNIFPVID